LIARLRKWKKKQFNNKKLFCLSPSKRLCFLLSSFSPFAKQTTNSHILLKHVIFHTFTRWRHSIQTNRFLFLYIWPIKSWLMFIVFLTRSHTHTRTFSRTHFFTHALSHSHTDSLFPLTISISLSVWVNVTNILWVGFELKILKDFHNLHQLTQLGNIYA